MPQRKIDDPRLEEAVSRLVDALHPRAIILFGSRARGEHRPESDYDLLVISDELRDYDEVYATGFTDLLGDGAMLVEWLDRVPRAAPREMMLVLFENLGGQRRRLSARAVGARYCALLEQWISRRAAAARRSRQRARS